MGKQCRDNALQKLITANSREGRAKRKQTFSAAKGSCSRFGTHPSLVDPDDPRGLIRMYAADRRRKRPKVSLAPMPWDAKP